MLEGRGQGGKGILLTESTSAILTRASHPIPQEAGKDKECEASCPGLPCMAWRVYACEEMKAILCSLGALCLFLNPVLGGVRYVTHNVAGADIIENRGPVQRTLTVNPTDLVEVAGFLRSAPPKIRFDFADGTGADINGWPNAGEFVSFTGLTQITTTVNGPGDFYAVTYKITSPSESLVSGVVIHRLLHGSRPSWESDLRASRERHTYHMDKDRHHKATG